MDRRNAEEVIKSLLEMPFICGSGFIETENGYLITYCKDSKLQKVCLDEVVKKENERLNEEKKRLLDTIEDIRKENEALKNLINEQSQHKCNCKCKSEPTKTKNNSISENQDKIDKICDAESICIGKNFTACLDKLKSEWQSALEEIFRKNETEKECSSCICKEIQYADIYGMFDSVFAWLEKFYLGDNCYFIVSRTGATFHRDGGLTILPENFRKRIYPKDNSTDKK